MNKRDFYDVVIIGGRIAGASVAIRLGRMGLKVVLVEPAPFGSNTLSTHFLWPRAFTYLDNLDVFSNLAVEVGARKQIHYRINEVSLFGKVDPGHIDVRMKSLHGDSQRPATGHYACIRRQCLDAALLEAAAKAGVEILTGTKMVELCTDLQGSISAIVAQTRDKRFQLKGRFFIAADGRMSPTARKLNLPFLERQKVSTACTWTYFSGLNAADVRLVKLNDSGFATASTNDGLTMVLAWGAQFNARKYLCRDDRSFLNIVDEIDPVFGERLRDRGRREEKLYSAAGLDSFKRQGAYKNVMLLGDAVCFKDQCTASGILHAFRDAYLASDAILEADKSSHYRAFLKYAMKRASDTAAYFQAAVNAAKMLPPSIDEIEMLKSCQKDPKLAALFFSTISDSLPVVSEYSSIASHPDHTGVECA